MKNFLGSFEDIALEHLDHMSSSIDYSLLNIFYCNEKGTRQIQTEQ